MAAIGILDIPNSSRTCRAELNCPFPPSIRIKSGYLLNESNFFEIFVFFSFNLEYLLSIISLIAAKSSFLSLDNLNLL